jgi:hypothetical protein
MATNTWAMFLRNTNAAAVVHRQRHPRPRPGQERTVAAARAPVDCSWGEVFTVSSGPDAYSFSLECKDPTNTHA